MAYNNEQAQVIGRPWLALDIETCPMPDCAQYLPDDIQAPANYKDADKIAKFIEEQRAKQIARAGLDLDLCEVVAIGIEYPLDRGYVETREIATEAEMLRNVWTSVRHVQEDGGDLVGYNCIAFDLPILLRRSLYLGIPTPKLNIDKYRHEGVIDVMLELTFNGRMPYRSLGFYCRRFGIPHDDTVDGSQIAGLAAAGDWAAIEGHVRADVTATAALAARCGLIYVPAMQNTQEVA